MYKKVRTISRIKKDHYKKVKKGFDLGYAEMPQKQPSKIRITYCMVYFKFHAERKAQQDDL